MAVSSQQATPSTAQIVIEILELLDAHTDSEHGITATEISKRISVSEKTVRGHLKALRDMPTIRPSGGASGASRPALC